MSLFDTFGSMFGGRFGGFTREGHTCHISPMPCEKCIGHSAWLKEMMRNNPNPPFHSPWHLGQNPNHNPYGHNISMRHMGYAKQHGWECVYADDITNENREEKVVEGEVISRGEPLRIEHEE